MDRLNERNVRLLSLLSGFLLIYITIQIWDHGFYIFSVPTFLVGCLATLIAVNGINHCIFTRYDDSGFDGEVFNLNESSSKILWIRVIEKVAAGLFLVASTVFGIVGVVFFDKSEFGLGWFFYLLSILMILLVPFLIRGLNMERSRQLRSIKVSFPLFVTLFLTAIVIMAVFIRIYNVSELPAGLWYDEADNIVRAGQIHASPFDTPVFVPSTHLPSAFLIPIAILQEITGSLWWNGRLVAMGFSVFLVLGMFYFSREVFEAKWGLAAAFLASVMSWSLNWGRIGMHGITAAAFSAFTGFLLWKSLIRWSPFWFFWTGFILGVGMWFYAPFRLFPLVILVSVLLRLISDYPGWRKLLACLVAMGVATIITTSPLIHYAYTNSDIFFKRTDETFIMNHLSGGNPGRAILENFTEHISMFHISGDPNPRHNLPLEPMLDDVTGSLLIVGLIIVLAKCRQPLYLLFVFWLFIMLLPGILSVPWESPQSLRSIGVIPAVIIIALFPVVLFWNLLKSHSYLIIRRTAVFAILFLFGFIGYLNLSIYFGKQAGHPEVFSDFSTSETIMAKEMVKQSQNAYTLYSSRQFLYSLTASVVSGNVHYEPLFAPRDLPISPERVLNGAAIYLEPRDSGMYELLAEYYPSAKFRVITAPNGKDPILYEVLISKDQLKNTTGVELTFHHGDLLVKKKRIDLFSSQWVKDLAGIDFPAEFMLESNLHVRQSGKYQFEVLGKGQLYIDDLPYSEFEDGIRLGPGLHTIRVEGTALAESGFSELLWGEYGGTLDPVPASVLFRGQVRPIGLSGVIYKESQPLSSHIGITPDAFYYDPPFKGIHEAYWFGLLEVSIPSTYQFNLIGNDEMELYVNGVLVSVAGNEFSAKEGSKIDLSKGEARIEVRYISSGEAPSFKIFWTSETINNEQLIPVGLIEPDYSFMKVP